MTAFDNDRWEAERKARLERVGGGRPSLETAARACCEAAGREWGDCGPLIRSDYIAQARAVLMAVRDDPSVHDHPDGRANFAAFINAILAEPQP